MACRLVSRVSMNPTRSLGPTLVMCIYKGFWIYVVGPFVRAILGVTFYNFIILTNHSKKLVQAQKYFKLVRVPMLYSTKHLGCVNKNNIF